MACDVCGWRCHRHCRSRPSLSARPHLAAASREPGDSSRVRVLLPRICADVGHAPRDSSPGTCSRSLATISFWCYRVPMRSTRKRWQFDWGLLFRRPARWESPIGTLRRIFTIRRASVAQLPQGRAQSDSPGMGLIMGCRTRLELVRYECT